MSNPSSGLIDYLQQELSIPEASLDLARRQAPGHQDTIHMVLWHYGLISLAELEQVFDWLETSRN